MPFDCEKCKKTYTSGWPAPSGVCYRCDRKSRQRGFAAGRKKRDEKAARKKLEKVKRLVEARKAIKEFKEERRVEYHKYIKSKAWKRKADEARKRAGYSCTRCGIRAPLTVHHWTYERFGREHPDDLSAMCWPCHKLVHRLGE